MSTGLRLHLRDRRVPATVLGVAVVVLVTWLAGEWLRTRPTLPGPAARVPAAVLGPLLAAVLVGPGLEAADPGFAVTTPRIRRPQRLVHVLLVLVVPAAAVLLAGLYRPGTWGSWAMARNAAGLAGFVVLGAAVLGARLCWAPAFLYTVTVYLAAPRPPHGPAASVWAWPMQPSTDRLSWAIAAVLVAAAVVAHVVRTRPPGREPPD